MPDVDAVVVIGAVFRLLARRLRRGGLSLAGLDERLAEWVRSYQRPQPRRWARLAAGPVPSRSPFVPDVPVQQMPDVLPPGRPRLAEEQIAENHRLRILYAAARLSSEQGYLATTVAQITRLAGVDGRIFYRHFSDKQEAVVAAHELGFQQVVDVTGRAFFSVQGWPQRSWEAGRAMTCLLEENPVVARVGFVEAYAIGEPTVQRIEDSHMTFMFFLQEGLLSAGVEPKPSREAMEAIIDAIFEIVYMRARASERPKLAEMLAPIMHIWLTPFLGAAATEEFIERQTSSRSNKRESSAG
jgi:AcrR family transcriptional regulator